MRHALIIAGGSGTRLWPMSRRGEPKQLLPIVEGRSLLELAWERLDGLLPPGRRWVCAGEAVRGRILAMLPALSPEHYVGEPECRDTLAALAVSTSVIAREDPDAVVGVFTADQLIEPAGQFRSLIAAGFDLVDRHPGALVTFGITPTGPATGYGYLELGAPLEDEAGGARKVLRFKEKPDRATAERYLADGPGRYLWNSGMFLWKAAGFASCLRQYEPPAAAAAERIASSWSTAGRTEVLARVYPGIRKTSVDFAVMEPASVDPGRRVAAIPLPLAWRDIGSWSSYAEGCVVDADGNAVGAGAAVLAETRGVVAVSSEPTHLVATLGCEDLIVVHTPRVTLVCRRDRAEEVKRLQERVARQFGDDYC